MYGPINVKSPNNISEWQMGFNSAFKGLIPCNMFIFTLILLHQTLMHYLSYTKSRYLADIPTRFGARRRHLQGAPPQLLPGVCKAER